MESKLLHAAELIAEKMVERYDTPAEPEVPVAVRRRAMANAMQIWRKCPRATCRRAQACLGDPLHCLHGCFPGVDPGYAAAFVAQTRRRKRA